MGPVDRSSHGSARNRLALTGPMERSPLSKAFRLAVAEFRATFGRDPRFSDRDLLVLAAFEEQCAALIRWGTYEAEMLAAVAAGDAQFYGVDEDGSVLYVFNPIPLDGLDDPAR